MNHILLTFCVFLFCVLTLYVLMVFINITNISTTQEGFNSYFRQTMRPHFRTVSGIKNMTIDQVSLQLTNIRRFFGVI